MARPIRALYSYLCSVPRQDPVFGLPVLSWSNVTTLLTFRNPPLSKLTGAGVELNRVLLRQYEALSTTRYSTILVKLYSWS